MPRKTDRNFLVDFATLDIEYLPVKGPKVSDDIQMVYIMGDVTSAVVAPAVAPLQVGWRQNRAAIVAQRSGIDLTAVGRPIRITKLCNNGQVTRSIWTIGAGAGFELNDNIVVETPDWQLNGTTAATLRSGGLSGAAPTAILFLEASVGVGARLWFEWNGDTPLIIPVGQTLMVIGNPTNATVDTTVLWEEIL